MLVFLFQKNEREQNMFSMHNNTRKKKEKTLCSSEEFPNSDQEERLLNIQRQYSHVYGQCYRNVSNFLRKAISGFITIHVKERQLCWIPEKCRDSIELWVDLSFTRWWKVAEQDSQVYCTRMWHNYVVRWAIFTITLQVSQNKLPCPRYFLSYIDTSFR